jgi:hypothetical protein
MIGKKVFRKEPHLLYCLITILILSCGQIKTSNDLVNSSEAKIHNPDSLINVIFQKGKQYLNIQDVDSILTLYGKPISIHKTQWGMSTDSLTTFKYLNIVFKFFELRNSKIDLESVSVTNKIITVSGGMSVGNTTRHDILKTIGLPDFDHNDPGRSITKSGDSIAYGTQSGAGDTVTFIYYDKRGDYAINFSMTNDTLRKITWTKNML